MSNTKELAIKLKAQLDNNSIIKKVESKSHKEKLDILNRDIDTIISNKIEDDKINEYLEELLKHSNDEYHLNANMDKFVTNINLLDNEINSNSFHITEINTDKGKQNIEDIQYIKDIQSKDSIKPALNVNQISKVLANVITELKSDSGQMIGIFGKWGRGKTYLANKLKDELEKEKKIKFHWIDFSAWKYTDSKQSWAYLYETVVKSYLDNDKENLCVKYLSLPYRIIRILWFKYGWFNFLLVPISIISIVYSIVNYKSLETLFESMTFYTISVIAIIKVIYFIFKYRKSAKHIIKKYISKEYYKDILGLQAEIEKEISIILKAWTDGKDEKIILFIDDLDRCNIEDIMKVLDGLRIILDNEDIYKRLIIITAIDENILKKSFELKYGKEDEKLFKEYLEKIFILGIKLESLTKDEVEEYTKNLIEFKEKDSLDEKNNVSQTNDSKDEKKEDTEDNNTNDSKDEEQKVIIDDLKNLKKPTPRRIRIFYCKYILLKKLYPNKDIKFIEDLIEIENGNKVEESSLAKIVALP